MKTGVRPTGLTDGRGASGSRGNLGCWFGAGRAIPGGDLKERTRKKADDSHSRLGRVFQGNQIATAIACCNPGGVVAGQGIGRFKAPSRSRWLTHR